MQSLILNATKRNLINTAIENCALFFKKVFDGKANIFAFLSSMKDMQLEVL